MNDNRFRGAIVGCAAIACVMSAETLAGDLLVSSRFTNNVLRFSAQNGQFRGVFASGHGMANPNGIAIGPDGNLYVGNGDEPKVLRFDGTTGAYVDEFINAATPGGLTSCRAIAFGPDGNLYVNSPLSDNVLKYDGVTGDFLGVAAAGNGMDGPVGLTIAPNGHVFVGVALTNAVYEFDAGGSFVRTLTCGASFSNATGVLFHPDGRLLVAGSVSNRVVSYDLDSGTCLGTFASGGSLSIPIAMIRAPDGDLLVGSFGNDSVKKYSISDGTYIGTFVTPGSGGLDGTHNFAFVPDRPVPAVSTWGLAILALLFASAGTLAVRAGRTA